jgi:hypothetical protein
MMKRTTTIISLAVAAGLAAMSQAANPPQPAATPQAATTAPPKTSGGKLEVPNPTFDFGYAPQHTKVTHVYWLKNSGTDTLRITDVRPGCGCTKSPLSKHALSPGDSTDVQVTFSTGAYSNQVHKTATIIADPPDANLPLLSFTAFPVMYPDSLRPLTFSPALLDLDSLRKAQSSPTWEYNVSIKNRSDHDVQIREISPFPGNVRADLSKGSIGAGKEIALRVKIDPVAADSMISKSLTFELSDSTHTRYTLPIVKDTRWGPAAPSTH